MLAATSTLTAEDAVVIVLTALTVFGGVSFWVWVFISDHQPPQRRPAPTGQAHWERDNEVRQLLWDRVKQEMKSRDEAEAQLSERVNKLAAEVAKLKGERVIS